jgi:hypothetical protein
MILRCQQRVPAGRSAVCSKLRQNTVLSVLGDFSISNKCLYFVQEIRVLAKIPPVFQELFIKAQKPVAFSKSRH